MDSGFNMYTVLLTALLVSGNAAVGGACMYQPDVSVQCEPIDNSMCHSLPGLHFNSTSFPNTYGHQNSDQAHRFLEDTSLLFLENLNCSVYTRIFICAAVFPVCYQRLFERVEPCREMCLAVRDGCETPLRNRLNRGWPDYLSCDRFAPYGTQLCIWNDSSSCSLASTVGEPRPQPPTQVTSLETGTMPVGTGPVCTGHLSSVNNSGAVFGGVDRCAEPCQGTYFEHDHRKLITMWIAAISFLSLLVAILVFFTFLLNYKAVHSLEVSVYYIVLCYGLLALTNLLSVAVDGGNIVCDNSFQNPYNQSILVVDGLASPQCSAFFSFGYYFTLCTWSWWMVLALEWSLTTLKRTSVSMEWKVLFHALAWGVPFVFLLMALFTRSFAGNPVLQTCWIRKHHEVAFVFIPLSAAILLCSVLVVITFPRIVNLRNKEFQRIHEGSAPCDPPNTTDPALLNRIGTYIVSYLIPMGLLFCTYFYDHWYRDAWERTYLTCSSSATSLQSCDNVPSNARPSVEVYMAQILASICMGFVSVFWLLRQRLLLAWRNLCCAFCIYSMQHYGQKPPAPTQPLPRPRRLEPIRIQMLNPAPLAQDSEV